MNFTVYEIFSILLSLHVPSVHHFSLHLSRQHFNLYVRNLEFNLSQFTVVVELGWNENYENENESFFRELPVLTRQREREGTFV
jgi:hypothetical protein